VTLSLLQDADGEARRRPAALAETFKQICAPSR
jgi:hypothetical protein